MPVRTLATLVPGAMGTYDSFTYPQHGFKLKAGKLHLSKIGDIKGQSTQKDRGNNQKVGTKKDDHRQMVHLFLRRN